MPEPSAVDTARPEPGGPAYRPISGYAVASFALAVLFAVLMAGIIATAWYSDVPLLDVGVLMLAVPALSILLAAVAWWEITASEGTKDGVRLARNGAVLSAVFGFGYSAYLLGTDVAVRQQAADFTAKWFQRLQTGSTADLRTAFWDTLEPARRKDVNPLAEADMRRFMIPSGRDARGPFPGFLQNELTRVFLQAGADAKPRLLGVKDWGYKNGGYTVQQSYRIESPDGTFEAVVTARGVESPRDFKGRQWQVVWTESGVVKRSLTARGNRLVELQQVAAGFVDEWVQTLNRGDLLGAWAGTLPFAERPSLAQRYASRLVVGSTLLTGSLWATSSAGAAPVLGTLPLASGDLGRICSLPGYLRFLNGGLIRDDELQASDAMRADLISGFRRLVASHADPDGRLKVRWHPRGAVLPRLEPGKPVTIGIEGIAGLVPSNQQTPLYNAEVVFRVECPPGSEAETGPVPFRVVSLSLQRWSDPSRPGTPPVPPQ